MSKKTTIILITIIALILISGGVYLWKNKAELQELNKNLPQGIRVERRDNQEVVVNTLDGYEIRVPKEWGGLENVDFREIGNEKILSIEGKKYQIATITIHNIDKNIDMVSYVKNLWEESPITYTRPEIFEQGKLGNYDLIKAKDFGGEVGDIFFYYLKSDSKIYEFSSDSEEVIQSVININF